VQEIQPVADPITRTEHDTFGDIDVPRDAPWGAQTQRSLEHFPISTERLPREFIHALAAVKRACAVVNASRAALPHDVADAIVAAADEVLDGRHDDAFPVSVWQTGSGTHTNMNMNEVLANRASVLMGGAMGAQRVVHPNDQVNLAQSSNDVFPTTMHVAAAQAATRDVIPALTALRGTLDTKSHDFTRIVKIGRTHLQDATPVTVGQEISGWSAQLSIAIRAIDVTLPAVCELAIGGTAVGTGLNAPRDFGALVARELARATGLPFTQAPNLFAALAGHDALVQFHGALQVAATALTKIANDVRLLASGPRCGLGEYRIPPNEPGSSIMPGKVNPTQCEALTMACAQVMGNHVAVTIGGASGHLQLNAWKPLIIHNVLQSTRDRTRIADLVNRSLMLVTALTPLVGYDRAAAIARFADEHGTTLRQAALMQGVSGDDFDRLVKLDDMV